MKTFYRSPGTLLCTRGIPLLTSLLLSLFSLLSAATYAQVNSYASVTSITTTGGKSKLNVINVNQTYHTFAVGEQVLVIQMQDDVIGSNTGNNANFGLLSAIANAGIYEVGTISAVTSTSITLTTRLTNTFTIGTHSQTQVVSFTLLGAGGNYSTTANIKAVNWDGTKGTGGVVAFQVGGTLTLKHSVTADGQGFAGGAASSDYEDACESDVYRINDDRYAEKGEGIYLRTSTNQINGRARILNGGGGGSDDNAGGAGGGNYTAGGNGGAGWTCSTDPSGGLGGIALSTYLVAGSRVFMGGGGGGGQGNNDHQTAGGAGGGIIIIKAANLITSCSSSSLKISANGANSDSTGTGGNDGAGGAGAAGTIMLQIANYNAAATCPLLVQANGGNGGDVIDPGSHGGGGGGGQGAIIFVTGSPGANISYATKPGIGGLNSSSSTTDRASNGGGTGNAGVIGGVGVVLPVNLLYFGAEKKNNQALLSWTSVDDGSITYSVQHSTDGIDFTTIGTVKATGNGTASGNYSFTDANAATGKNYYRLEIAGSFMNSVSYSNIALINLSDLQSIPVAYPNPAHDHFNLRINNLNSNTNYTITITDLTGQIVFTTSIKPAGGIITVSLNRPLKPGLYMYKLNGTEQTGKLMIQ